jgi:WD40 repeat protein
MKTSLFQIFLSLGLAVPSVVFAQPRCENIFVSEQEQIINDMARLYVDIENSSNTLVQKTLNRQLRLKREMAENARLDLSVLTAKIDQLRTEKNRSQQAREDKIRATNETEEKMFPFLKPKIRFEKTGGSPLRNHFSADGQFVFTHFFSGAIEVLDTSTGGVKTKINKESNLLDQKQSLSADGKFVFEEVYANSNSYVKVTELATGNLVADLKLSPEYARRKFEISPDHRFIATGYRKDHSGPITLWDLKTQQELGTVEPLGKLADMKFSANGNRLLTYDTEGNAIVWDTKTRSIVSQTQPPIGRQDRGDTECYLNAQGTQAVVRIYAQSFLWDLASGNMTQVKTTAWSLLLNRYAKYRELHEGKKWIVELFDLSSQYPVAQITVEADRIAGLSLNGDGSQIAVTLSDGTTRVWELIIP